MKLVSLRRIKMEVVDPEEIISRLKEIIEILRRRKNEENIPTALES